MVCSPNHPATVRDESSIVYNSSRCRQFRRHSGYTEDTKEAVPDYPECAGIIRQRGSPYALNKGSYKGDFSTSEKINSSHEHEMSHVVRNDLPGMYGSLAPSHNLEGARPGLIRELFYFFIKVYR